MVKPRQVLKLCLVVWVVFFFCSLSLQYALGCFWMCSTPPECLAQGRLTGFSSLGILVVGAIYGITGLRHGRG